MAVINISTGCSGRLTASFTFSPFIVSRIKKIDGYRWHPKEKYWSFPNSTAILKILIKLFENEDLQIDPSIIAEHLDMF